MALNLASVEQKLSRATELRDVLEIQIRTWHESLPYKIIYETNGDLMQYSWNVQVMVKPDLAKWSRIFADAVHNLRASLDNLIYEIAVHELSAATLRKVRGDIGFPMHSSKPVLFEEDKCIKMLNANIRQAVGWAQPFNRLHATLPPLLSVLTALDNADKHRKLTTVRCMPLSGKIKNTRNVPADAVCRMSHEELEDGMRLAWMTLKSPISDVYYEPEVEMAVIIDHAPGPTGIKMSAPVKLLDDIMAEVRLVIDHVVEAIPDKTKLNTEVVRARGDSHCLTIITKDAAVISDTVKWLRSRPQGRQKHRKFWMLQTETGRVLAQQVAWKIEIDRVACREELGEDI